MFLFYFISGHVHRSNLMYPTLSLRTVIQHPLSLRQSHVLYRHKLNPNVWIPYCYCHNLVIYVALRTGNLWYILSLTQVKYTHQWKLGFLLSQYWTFKSYSDWLNRRTRRNRENELLERSGGKLSIYNKSGMGRNSWRMKNSFLKRRDSRLKT